jgi:hypothetical protein
VAGYEGERELLQDEARQDLDLEIGLQPHMVIITVLVVIKEEEEQEMVEKEEDSVTILIPRQVRGP